MEDVVDEIQNTVSPDDKRSSLVGEPAAGIGAEQRVEQVRDEAEEIQGEKERPMGLINNSISTIGSVTGGDDEEKNGSGGLSGEERNIEEEKESGGPINHLISNLVSPILSPRVREFSNKRKADEFESESKQEDKRGDGLPSKSVEEFGGSSGGDGGILKGLISNIFHQDQDPGVIGGEERKVKDVNQGAEQVKSERGGGLVESLVSSLPTPLAEDAAPATDEASILIHSIVHE
ncbi:uncharacterized protein [Coffea arabica]|uniref:Uncharacterized protein n=1 Tax=Coffea arabica TaxID=13443 RepID=A0A6P6SZ45_COFAR|nr:uncharacterized protein LOC113692784 [Coffea arabica]XP_027071092.1 uncharacterized protein LOC113696010 [Coffea arabica]